MSEKSSEVRMRELVAAVAGPVLPSDNRESWLRRAAHRAGTTYRTARALWYGEIVDPYHSSVTRFREAAGRHEARNLAVQFQSLAGALNVADPDFHRDTIAALLGAARAISSLNSTGTEGVRGTECKPSKETGP